MDILSIMSQAWCASFERGRPQPLPLSIVRMLRMPATPLLTGPAGCGALSMEYGGWLMESWIITGFFESFPRLNDLLTYAQETASCILFGGYGVAMTLKPFYRKFGT